MLTAGIGDIKSACVFIYLFFTMSYWSMTLQQWALAVSDQSSRFMSEAAARLPSLLSERADLSKC